MTEVGSEGSLVPWWRRADWGALLVVVVALVSAWPSLGNGFAYDDVPIVEANPAVLARRWPWAYFTESYWSPPWGSALYRPLTIWLFSMQWWMADWAPVTFHIVNVTAYAVAATLVLALGRTLLRPVLALVAALVWAVHPVHVEVVGNVVGQSELWVVIGSLTALLGLQRMAADGQVRWPPVVGVVGGVIVALTAKENGIVLPVLVAVRWMILARSGGLPAADLARGWAMVRGIGYVTALYLGARFGVLGTLGGDGAHLSLAELETDARVLAALGLLVAVGRLLLLGSPLQADYSPPHFPLHTTVDAHHLWAGLLVLGWVIAGWWVQRRRGAGWVALWFPLALAPTANLVFPTGIVLAERSLFVPSVPWVLVTALLIDTALRRWGAKVGRPVRLIAVTALGLLLLEGIGVSRARQLVWADTATVVAWSHVDAPTNPRWQGVIGVQFLRMGEFDRAEAHLRAAEALGSEDSRVWRAMHLLLERQGRDAEALEYYGKLVRRYPPTFWTQLGMEACLLRLRRFSDARRLAFGARVETSMPEPHSIVLQLAESALVALDSAAVGNTWRRAGRPTSRSNDPVIIFVNGAGQLVRRDPRRGTTDLELRQVVAPAGVARPGG